MEIFSHILWPMMLFRNKLWREEALFFALLPDISFLMILLFVFFGTPMDIGWHRAMYRMPDIFRDFYFLMHSFVTLAVVAAIVWRQRPRLLPALSGWFLHICLDIPVHDGEFATRFLYPLFPDIYFSGISWLDIRILPIAYLMFLNFALYSFWREKKKHRMGTAWKEDWVDKLDSAAGKLLSKLILLSPNGKEQHRPAASGELSGQDQSGPGEGEVQPTETVNAQKPGRRFLRHGKRIL